MELENYEKMGIYIDLLLKNLANGIVLWEWELKRERECRASIKLEELYNFVKQFNGHTHPPSASKCETTKVKENIKRRACNSLDNPREIVSVEVQNV